MLSTISKTFASLRVRNFRLYYFAQIISMAGTFLQAMAQDWLVLQLTNSGTMLGITLTLQFAPMLVLPLFGGMIADRFPRLKLIYITQSVATLLAVALGIMVLTHTVTVGFVLAFAFCLGITNSIDNPVRQAFLFDLVGSDHIQNASSLWTALISISRITGPALAGVLIASIGIGWCFIVNALSFLPVFVALFMMRVEHLHIQPAHKRTDTGIVDGLRYVATTPSLFITVVMLAIIGTFTFEWQASVPLFAKFTLHGNAATYSYLMVAEGIGLFVGSLLTSHMQVTTRRAVLSAGILGLLLLFNFFASNILLAMLLFFAVGLVAMIFINTCTVTLRTQSAPHMRGRVMSLWTISFQGSTAIGGPIIGWIGERSGASMALAVGGVAAIVGAGLGYVLNKNRYD